MHNNGNLTMVGFIDLVRKILSRDFRGIWRTERFKLYVKFIENSNIILDVGCGKCSVLQYISSGAVYIGVDIDSESIKNSIEKGSRVVADARFLPIRKNSITSTLCAELIEHMSYEDAEMVLKGIYASLKKGGKLILSTPNKRDLLSRLQQRLRFKRLWAETSYHIHLYEPKELDSLLRKNDFFILESVKFLVFGCTFFSFLFYPISLWFSRLFPASMHTLLIRVCSKDKHP